MNQWSAAVWQAGCIVIWAMGSLPVLVFLVASGAGSPPDPQQTSSDPVDPIGQITGIDRLNWTVHSTIGPPSLWTGVLSATWGTGFNKPNEYGRSFDGFAKRYGLRLTGVATSNVMEAGLGAIWGEDPRYHRADARGFGTRLSRAFKMTVEAQNRDGRDAPAYARFIAIAGSNAISDTWRPDSQKTAGNTMLRIGLGFGGRLAGNLWEEFWPDVRQHLFFFNKH